MVFKGIRIRRDQVDWLDLNSIAFSELVRKLLDEEIAKREGKANGTVPAPGA